MNTLPTELLLLIAEELSYQSFFRFCQVNKRLYHITKKVKEERKIELLTGDPKKAARDIVSNNDLQLFINYQPPVLEAKFLVRCLFHCSIMKNNLFILQWLLTKYEEPEELLYLALCSEQYEMANWLHSTNRKLRTRQKQELLESGGYEKWFLENNIITIVEYAICIGDIELLDREIKKTKIKDNHYILLACQCNKIEVFKWLEDNGYHKGGLITNVCKMENLEAIFHLYNKGNFTGKNEYIKFFNSENDKFVYYMINNKIKLDTFQQALNTFNIDKIEKYHKNGSKTALPHFYFNAPKDKIKIAFDRGIINRKEYEDRCQMKKR